MSLLNPIVSKFLISQGAPQEVYMCPTTKSHAVIDLSFFRDDITTTSVICVGLASESNPAALTSLDYFIDDIELINEVNSGELTKVIVGRGERLFVWVISGTGVSVRVSGVEENNSKVLKAGRLGAANITTTNQTQLFDASTFVGAAYLSASVTLFNNSATENATVEMWVTSSETPGPSDKVMLITIPMEDTTIVENLMMQPNEKIFMRTSVANMETFLNGTVISQ